jgi:hypothetical protein
MGSPGMNGIEGFKPVHQSLLPLPTGECTLSGLAGWLSSMVNQVFGRKIEMDSRGTKCELT